MFPNRTFIFPDYESFLELLFWIAGFLVFAVMVGCLFYVTGSAIFASALGGLFVLAVVVTGGIPELFLSISVTLMLKLGSGTAVALIKPWGGEQALDETLSVIMETSFPQLTLGIFIIIFFLLTIPQHAIERWRK